MQVFYAPDACLGHFTLSEEESQHCSRVLRMQSGDKALITNGKGSIFDAIIQVAHPKKTIVNCEQARPGHDYWPFGVHIALAPTKNIERTEWFIEKATEIGIDKISLFFSEHSERKVIKPERLIRTAVAAMKQSVKSRLPEINVVSTFEELIKKPIEGQRFIAWIDESVKFELSDAVEPGAQVLVLIGPEGDFSPAEVDMARSHGFVPVSLGRSRLRTETAALTACHIVHLVNHLKKQQAFFSVISV